MTVGICRATLDDLPAVARLCAWVQDLHASNLPDRFKHTSVDSLLSWFRVRLDDPRCMLWVAKTEGSVVGYLLASAREQGESEFGHARHWLFLDQLAVDEAIRRCGVARALVDALVDEAKSVGAGEIELNSWLFNDDAHKAFVRLGFEPSRLLYSRRLPTANGPTSN